MNCIIFNVNKVKQRSKKQNKKKQGNNKNIRKTKQMKLYTNYHFMASCLVPNSKLNNGIKII